jgi:alginate O-acetyltransferase complex protein AlgI
MLFVESRFFLFFAVVLAVYWSLRSNSIRKNWLLASSYFFYGSWDWRFAVMLATISCADFLLARRIESSSIPRTRKLFVTASLLMNLSILGVFKYFNFFAASASHLASAVGFQLDEPTLNIILPVGVSFFTFQSLSYTIDVYRGEIQAAKSARDYLLFAAFFPQLVAGPIVRPRYFLPQLEAARPVDSDAIRAAIVLFLIGFIKKTAIADNVSPYVDAAFASPADLSNWGAVTAVWLYASQIYCDFSGYSDMAIAVAAMMGYRLVLNFDAPYLATSIQDFWRRWHISLSSWIRDYIYISLGGRSQSRVRTYRNLLFTMLAGGLWHGAAWTFVAWGGMHGIALVIYQEFERAFHARTWRATRLWALFSWFLTLQFVCVCWVLFRSSSFTAALQMLGKCLFIVGGGDRNFPILLTFLPIALLVVQFAVRSKNLVVQFQCLRDNGFGFGLGATVALAIALLPLGHRPFIYFQF